MTLELEKLEKKKGKIDPIDRLLILHLVDHPSATNAELGQLVNMTRQGIHLRRNKPVFREYLIELLGSTESHLKEAAARAAIRLGKLIHSDDETVATQASKIALTNHLTQKIDMTIQPVIRYKTTVEADGSLLQEIMDEDKHDKKE